MGYKSHRLKLKTKARELEREGHMYKENSKTNGVKERARRNKKQEPDRARRHKKGSQIEGGIASLKSDGVQSRGSFLVLAGIKLNFFLGAAIVLWFGFRMRIMLITH